MLLKKNFKGEETFTEFTHVGLGSNLVTLCPFFPKIMTTSRLHAFNVELLLGGTTEMFPEEPVVMQVCHLSRPLSSQHVQCLYHCLPPVAECVTAGN